MDKRKWYEFDSAMLHVLGMCLMLCDHAWSALFPAHRFLTSIGRIAFPIFAFMIAEGYFHTRDFNKYLKRMFIFALISEIPFNLMMGGSLIGPYHQNVMWTFVIALIGMKLMDKIRVRYNMPLRIIGCAGVVLISFVLGFAGFVDYYGTGVITVYIFYFFNDRKKWWTYLGQFVCMYYLNVELLGGYCFFINIFGMSIEVVEQGLALLSLVPIWLYQGKQGYHSKPFKYFCYAFYPAHMLVLVLIGYLTTIF